MKLTGAQIVTEVLIEQGVDTVFGYPGGTVLHLFDALYDRQDDINFYLTAHEQGATHAADGYARATGKPGVVAVTSGPGATNTVTGIATAHLDSIPMVVITANVSRNMIGRDSFQEAHITGITMPITKHNHMVKDIDKLADSLREAFAIANGGRKGPVLVDIPKDILLESCEFTPAANKAKQEATCCGEAELCAAAKLINESERPVVLYGGGIISSGASQLLDAFLSKGNLPAASTMMGLGALLNDNPHYLGMAGMHGCVAANRAIAESDLLIAMGVRFSDRVAQRAESFAPGAKVLQIDIDPSEMRKNVRADMGIAGDIGAVLCGLTKEIDPAQTRTDWLAQIESFKAEDYTPPCDRDVLRPYHVMDAISRLARESLCVVTDVGQHQLWAAQYIRNVKPRRFITSGGFGTMGFGYGAAIGAKLGCPDATVVHITSDGSFHMNMNEACTAVTYGVKVITIIMNNCGLGMVRQWQDIFLNKRRMATEPDRKTDYLKLGEGFGVKTLCAQTPEAFEAAFCEALAAQGPVWIECPICPDERVLPMIPNGQTVDQTILQ